MLLLQDHEIRQQQEFLRRQHEMIRQAQMAEQHKMDQKPDKSTISREMKMHSQAQNYKGYPPSTSSSSSNVKPEPSFSLFGYQPFTHSYINPDQLHLVGLTGDKHCDEKMSIDSKQGIVPQHRSGSPKRSKTSVPPPLIKDMKAHGGVIVENKVKDHIKSTSPRPAHSHYSSITIPMSSSSPRPQPAHTKPAHTSDLRHHDRPRSAMSSSSPGAHHYQDLSNQSMDLSSSASQMSFKNMKPENKYSRLNHNQAMHAQPLDFRGKVRSSPHSNKSVSPGSVSNSSSGQSGHHYNVSAAIAQPPVSLPASVAFSYSLIQQGLVPNPIYSQSTVKSVPSTNSVDGKNSIPMNNTSPNGQQQPMNAHGMKRKQNRESGNRKRQKGEHSPSGAGIPGGIPAHSVPVTTPQIMTNQSPYTTTSSLTVSTALSNSTMTTSSFSSNVSSLSSASMSSSLATMMAKSSLAAASNNAGAGASGFMDSFKSFVENAVQNAFFQDSDLNRNKANTTTTSATGTNNNNNNSLKSLAQQHQEKQKLAQVGKSPPPPSFNAAQTPPPQFGLNQQQAPPQQQRRKSDPTQFGSSGSHDDNVSLGLSGSTSSLSSHATLMETINRVANGQIDTDSDTLSAPSPPPHVKSDASPHKSGHPKLKKAWLQRHSDEDKELKNSSPIPSCENSQNSQKGEKNEKGDLLKNCYVNCSYISPSKEGGSRSPISALPRINGLKDGLSNDESTTSASETETAQVK